MKKNSIKTVAQKTAKVTGLLISSAWTGFVIYGCANKIRENGKKIAAVITE